MIEFIFFISSFVTYFINKRLSTKLLITSLFTAYCLLFTIFFSSCGKDSTKGTDTITISGTVTLEGQTDYNGVTVMLFKPVQLDTALVRINQQYPNIGVQISQETEFDHREHTAAYSATTNASGAWSIANVAAGTYNIVAEKDSFGWRYVYSKNLNTDTQIGELDSLFKTLYLSGIIAQDVELKPSQHLKIVANAFINQNVNLIINNGCWLLLAKDATITNNGNLIILGNSAGPVMITSSDLNNKWKEISNTSSAHLQITSAVILNSNSGIKINGNVLVQISQSYFKNNNRGLQLSNSPNVVLSSLLFNKNTEGLNFGNIDSLIVLNSIFHLNNSGIIGSGSNLRIENACLKQNDEALNMSLCRTKLKNCLIQKNDIGILTTGGFSYEVYYCSFTENEIDVRTKYVYLGGAAQFFIGNNNFENTHTLHFDQRQGSLSDTAHAEKNWWGTTDVSAIYDKIIDFSDNQSPDFKPVQIIPLLTQPQNEAGIK